MLVNIFIAKCLVDSIAEVRLRFILLKIVLDTFKEFFNVKFVETCALKRHMNLQFQYMTHPLEDPKSTSSSKPPPHMSTESTTMIAHAR